MFHYTVSGALLLCLGFVCLSLGKAFDSLPVIAASMVFNVGAMYSFVRAILTRGED